MRKLSGQKSLLLGGFGVALLIVGCGSTAPHRDRRSQSSSGSEVVTLAGGGQPKAAGGRSSSAVPHSGTVRRTVGGGASALIPRRWSVAPYNGIPAPVLSPVAFWSSSPLQSRCAAGKPDPTSCTTSNWFPPDVQTPSAGVVVLWLNAQFPTNSAFNALPGRLAHIDHHVARVSSGRATSACPKGATQEVQAFVQIATRRYGPAHLLPGGRIDMTACIGGRASADDRAAVTTMVHSLHIHTTFWYPR